MSSSGRGRAPTRSSRRAELLGVPVERYAGKNLDQAALGREYAAARVFAVGSWFEGFCQPGLESLACGTPLVTTDNGGCREYAIDGETALVVPPRDARAMADAIRRLLDDEALAARFVANGLDLVERDFDWERRTDEFEAVLDGVVRRTRVRAAADASRPRPPSPSCRSWCSRGTTSCTRSSSSTRCGATPTFRTSS